MPQPAYRAELGPTDFFLFGFLKQELQGVHLADREALKTAICQLLSQIHREVLMSVSADWMERLKWMIENGGSYYNH
jgi:hypothetical protein